MKRNKLPFVFKTMVVAMALMLLSSFNAFAQSGEDVPFDTYPYFSTLSNAKDGTLNLVIKSDKDKERVFGPSGFIGPTPTLNFDEMFIIAVVVPKEIAQASIEPVSLKKDGGKLHFYYTIDTKKKTSNSYRSNIAIMVDRKQPTKVVFHDVSQGSINVPKDAKAQRQQLEYLTHENAELKAGIEQLRDDNLKLEAERNYLIQQLKERDAQIEKLKKVLHH